MTPIELLSVGKIKDFPVGAVFKRESPTRWELVGADTNDRASVILEGQYRGRIAGPLQGEELTCYYRKFRFEVDESASRQAGNYAEILGSLILSNARLFIAGLRGGEMQGVIRFLALGDYPPLDHPGEGMAFPHWQIVADKADGTSVKIFPPEET